MQNVSVEIVSKSKAPERVYFVDEVTKYCTMNTEVYMLIPTLLEKLRRKAPWGLGCIKKLPTGIGTDKFIVGEEILFLVLGNGEKVWVTKMPKVDRTTHFDQLNSKMICEGVIMSPSCITAYSKE